MPKKSNSHFPTRASLIEATFKAITGCGGSATNDEIQEHVIEILELPDHIINMMHADNTQTRLHYELRWARTYLKKYGAIDNSVRGVWSIASGFENKTEVDGNLVCQKVRGMDTLAPSENTDVHQSEAESPASSARRSENETDDEPWRAGLSKVLHEMDPYAFERLAMRLLRECGFSKVSVTKKSGDNGIDGFGKVSLNGIVTINVAFQCKRYAGLVSNSAVLDFRGSLPAGIEKGIFITTGAFSNAAVQEAMDFGKTPTIDLIDGENLINLLLEHDLGVSKEVRMVYGVNKSFFEEI